MTLGQLKEILNTISDDTIEVVTYEHGCYPAEAVIIDEEGQLSRDFSWVKRKVLFLNNSTQVMKGYTPVILVPKPATEQKA